MHVRDVIAAHRLVVTLYKLQRRPGADQTRLDRLIEQASKRAERKQAKFKQQL